MKTVSFGLLTMFATSGFLISGCSESTNSKPSTLEKAESSTEPASSKTRETYVEYVSPLPDDAPVIKVGTEANYTPFEFEDHYGKVIGFDIDLIRAVGENQGFKVEIYNDSWEEVFENLETGKRHMVAAGLNNNPKRKKKYGMSSPYITSRIEIAYATDKPKIKNIDDLKSLKFAGVANTSEVSKLNAEVKDLQFQYYPTLYLAIKAMATGKADAVIAESNVLHYFFNDLEVDAQYYPYQPNAQVNEFSGLFFAIEKDNTELLHKVNTGLEAIESDGTYAKLTKKWFGLDLTPDLVEQRRKLNK